MKIITGSNQLIDFLSSGWPKNEIIALQSLLSLFDSLISNREGPLQPELTINSTQKASFVRALYSELENGNLDPIGKALSFFSADEIPRLDNPDFRLCIHACEREPLTVNSYSSTKSGSGFDVLNYLSTLANNLNSNDSDPFQSLWIRLEDPSRSNLIAAYVQITLLMKAFSKRVGRPVSPFCVELVLTHIE
ncbi:hypothetical protein [Shewanella baltica]|uniref:hypothetical protein n=1 Tax=Shewanella baltica TaxID=62322 RepID=UPI0039B05C69